VPKLGKVGHLNKGGIEFSVPLTREWMRSGWTYTDQVGVQWAVVILGFRNHGPR
jgi:hypothetical protein